MSQFQCGGPSPLPIIGLVGRCPANYLIGRMAILYLRRFIAKAMPPLQCMGD